MSLKWRSVRVANELGAGSGKGARFAIVVSVTTSVAIGLVFWCLIIAYNDKIALLFSSSKVVLDAVSDLSVLLAFTVLLNSVQPVLSGVAIGSGWQALVAYVNVGSYYLVGVPIGAILGWPLHFGVGVMIRTHPSTFLLVCFGGEAVILFECMAMFGLILTVHTQIAGNLVRVDWWHSCSDTDISLSHYQL
jgi:Na+-driven multidrug efflux pump